MRFRAAKRLFTITIGGFLLAGAGLPSDDWSVALTATGAEFATTVRATTIDFSGETAEVVTTTTNADGGVERRVSTIPRSACTALWQRLEAIHAWDLGDLQFAPILDAPDYTVHLQSGTRSHTIQIHGASTSPRHLELILAIEQAAFGGI